MRRSLTDHGDEQRNDDVQASLPEVIATLGKSDQEDCADDVL